MMKDINDRLEELYAKRESVLDNLSEFIKVNNEISALELKVHTEKYNTTIRKRLRNATGSKGYGFAPIDSGVYGKIV